MSMETGFIGLGSMGLPIATNLAAAGVKLRVNNRTAAKADPLLEKGAILAANPGDAATAGGIVMTMLADDAAVESVVMGAHGIAARLGRDGIHVSLSTISPATSRRLASYHAEHDNTYIAAPVFGRPDAAAARQLVVCTSGPAAAKDRVRPLLEAIGRVIYDYGEDPGAANVAKLTGNFLIIAALEAMGEAFAMAEANGIDRIEVAEMLGKTLFACPVYQRYGEMVAAKRHTPAGFALKLGLKDTDLILKTGGDAHVPMPIASLVRDRLVAALAHGRGEMDWSALALGVLDDAGIDKE
jgi:3-hydroxyisobutyrate dehydrogenase-like beta-hydroxyacid dehydrogenase